MSDVPSATLDATGLSCPLPILRARKALRDLPGGALLALLATDPAALRDVPSFCRQTGHQLVESGEQAEGVFRFLIRKAP